MVDPLENSRLEESLRQRLRERIAGAPVDLDLGMTSDGSLLEFHESLRSRAREVEPGGTLGYVARNPDASSPSWPGRELPRHPDERHRPWRIHVELLRLFGFELMTPVPIAGTDLVWVRALRHGVGTTGPVTRDSSDVEGRYGSESDYRDFDRLEEPEVLDDLRYCRKRLALRRGASLLAIGVNDGHELRGFEPLDGVDVTGLDVCATAIDAARLAFPKAQFHVSDLTDLERVVPEPVDVVLALNVLQCRTVDRDAVLAAIGRRTHDGSRVLISIPNCHRGQHDIQRRPLSRSDRRHDRSLVFKDARYYARHLYRKGRRRVEIFGTYDVFVLATPE